MGILESVSNMECAVGSYTTVLLQAHFFGKQVLLDDVAYEEQYRQMKEYGYILTEESEGIGCLSGKQPDKQ